jgi:multisubunit Na+/H+ antiporter MnhG subunit
VLGHDAKATSVAGSFGGLIFAFAAGLGGTFTACNIAAFSAIAPMMGDGSSTGSRVRAALRPLWWVAVGMVPLSAAYGAAGALLGDRLPQLSTEVVGPNGIPVRLLQSVAVFSVLGVAFVYLGLVALNLAPDPLRRLTARWPQTPQVVMGVLIALFLVGRPYPLFYKLFQYAADDRNPFYGALAFTLVSIGNILILGVIFVLLAVFGGRRLQRWSTGGPTRVASVTAVALLVAGVFTLVYWGVRLPAGFGYGWFPTAPWNG